MKIIGFVFLLNQGTKEKKCLKMRQLGNNHLCKQCKSKCGYLGIVQYQNKECQIYYLFIEIQKKTWQNRKFLKLCPTTWHGHRKILNLGSLVYLIIFSLCLYKIMYV